MEIRVLRYFLAAAQEGSVSRAAEYLHLTQPTLSRQMKGLEEELGRKLFERNERGLTLTEDGLRFRKRAEEIVELADRAAAEFQGEGTDLTGEVAIGVGETEAMALIAQVAAQMRRRHPRICVKLYSGSFEDVMEKLEKGLLDFGLLMDGGELEQYERLELPYYESTGLLVRPDDPLAALERVTPEDLRGCDVLTAQRDVNRIRSRQWLGAALEDVTFAGNYNMRFNAVQMVKAGYCRAAFIRCGPEVREIDGLRVVPKERSRSIQASLWWKRYQPLQRTAEAFLDILKEEMKTGAGSGEQ